MSPEEKSSDALPSNAGDGGWVMPQSRSDEADLTYSTLTDQAIASVQDGAENTRALGPTLSQTVGSLKHLRELSVGAPRVVPGFDMKRRLGQGTFGEVWLAEDLVTQRMVAIKFLHHGVGRNWGPMLDEVRRLAKFDSDPGIVHLLAVDPEGNPPCYVMNYAEGGSLDDRLRSAESRGLARNENDTQQSLRQVNMREPLSANEALELFRKLAESLREVHVKGICHCDLKPANILFDARDRPLIADFGQARFSHDASVSLGTFFYMAPEQADASDQRPDLRWDVYSLGAIVFECLTGRPPRYTGDLHRELSRVPDLAGRLEMYRKHMLTSAPPRQHHAVPKLRNDVARVIDCCLEVDPTKRFRDAGDVFAAIENCERRRRVLRARNIAFPIATAAIFIIFIAAYYFTNKEIGEARQTLSATAKNDFQVMARLLGKVVGRQIVKSRSLIEGLSVRHTADEREIAGLIKAGDSRGLHRFGRKWAEKIELAGFTLFLIADDRGKILLRVNGSSDQSADRWKVETSEELAGDDRRFSFREWFNGTIEQRELSDDGRIINYPPLTSVHISRPFWSLTRESNQWKQSVFGPAISAPIFDQGRIVGVIAAQIPREKLDHWSKELKLSNGFAVVLSEGCVLQSHPGFDQKALDQLNSGADQTGPGAMFMNDPTTNGHLPGESHSNCPYCGLKKFSRDGKLDDSHVYLDPLDGQQYTVAYAPLEVQTGESPLKDWDIVVQEKTRKLFKEFDDIARTAGRWWIRVLVVVLGCIAMFWQLSDWLLREQGRLGQIMKRVVGMLGISSRGQGKVGQSGTFSSLFPRAS